MSERGHLDSTKAQSILKAESRKMRGWELADLETILRSASGRRFYYRLVFEVCKLESSSARLNIREGDTAGLHTYFYEGQRSVAQTLALEAQTHCRELWVTMLSEALARDAADAVMKEKTIQSAEKDD
jgi:hypothetical protein